MNLLLDSQAFIYLSEQPEKLPVRARAAFEDRTNTRLLSVASAWEMQIKLSLGKLRFAKTIEQTIQFELNRGALAMLPITLAHIDELSRLPAHHRDPFDRIIIGQARVEGLTIVTGDQVFARYPVPTLWD